ncbi:MAG: AAA family ATPase [Chlamydiota bacterium]
MSKKIIKIASIKDMAVFKDFKWDCKKTVKDKEKLEEVLFKDVNIFYGLNASGKTTLSQIFRALEKKSNSDLFEKYENQSPQFSLSLEGGKEINQKQESLEKYQEQGTVRVFNRDFIKENLSFIIDEQNGSIKSFGVILGEEKIKLSEELNNDKKTLETEKQALPKADEDLKGKSKDFNTEKRRIEKALSKEASEIAKDKENLFNHPKAPIKDYNRIAITEDIKTIAQADSDAYRLGDKKKEEYKDTIDSKEKSEITPLSFTLNLSDIAEKAKTLCQKEISTAKEMERLKGNLELENWIREGRLKYRDEETNKCPFCNESVQDSFWEALDKHFNKGYKDLHKELDQLIESIDKRIEVSKTLKAQGIEQDRFYPKFTKPFKQWENEYRDASDSYGKALESIRDKVKQRKKDIFRRLKPEEFESIATDNPTAKLDNCIKNINLLCKESNGLTSKLQEEQLKASEALRLDQVLAFMKNNSIVYVDGEEQDTVIDYKNKKLKDLKKEQIEAKEKKEEIEKNIEKIEKRIENNEKQLQDESKAAEKISTLLKKTNTNLSLEAIKKESSEGTEQDNSQSHRFQVQRNGAEASNLSEGEKNLIAFCYFIAKLEDKATSGKKPIIWIDDPVSSLDANHIFSIHGLIKNKIVKKRNDFLQLFISTHSLVFLRYVQKLESNQQQFLIVKKGNDESTIELMPKYLKDYVTEFVYLFTTIYRCADDNKENKKDDLDAIFYNFGNQTRKFLELYLYYRYPDQEHLEEKMERFFGNSPETDALGRYINDESHRKGLIEYGTYPYPNESKRDFAKYILKTMEKKDPDQLACLVKTVDPNNTERLKELIEGSKSKANDESEQSAAV